MKTYIAELIPRIQRFSKRLDDLTKLTNQHWVSIGDISINKRVYIFETNGELDIYENGVEVDFGTWKLINQSLKLKLKSGGYLLKHGFVDENVIALKLDSSEEYAFFVNETKYHSELNNIGDVLKFLETKYEKSYDLGTTKKETINDGALYSYKVKSERVHKSLFGSRFIEFHIEFFDGSEGSIYKDISNHQFYFEDWFGDNIFDENFDIIVHKMYMEKKRNNR
jgi:hypothetical protein